MVMKMKKNSKTYHIFLFFSTFTRGLVETFSLVLLYKKGFSVHEIFFFLLILNGVGIATNYFCLKQNPKKVLIVSSLLYGFSFLYLSNLSHNILALIGFAVLLSLSTYSYHAIRHLLALKLLDHKKNTSKYVVLVMYLGIICSSLVGIYLIDKLPLIITSIIVFCLSFLSVIPIRKLSFQKLNHNLSSLHNVKIDQNKILFSIFEQFKVLFLELQPLFLYLYIDSSIHYVGIFNIIVNIASLIIIYFLAKRISKKYFRYFNIILAIILIIKLNIKNGNLLLGLAFLEGIFVKIYETISLENLYDLKNNSIEPYLIVEELIFFISKTCFLLFFYLFNLDIKFVMYICIVGLVISGFFIKESERTKAS